MHLLQPDHAPQLAQLLEELARVIARGPDPVDVLRALLRSAAIGVDPVQSDHEIGCKVGVSAARVRQIARRALRRLRVVASLHPEIAPAADLLLIAERWRERTP